MQSAIEIAGWIGTVIVVVAYLCVSLDFLQPGIRFQMANLVGSCVLLVNGAYHGAMPSVAVNLAWFVISAVAVIRMLIARRRTSAVDCASARPIPSNNSSDENFDM